MALPVSVRTNMLSGVSRTQDHDVRSLDASARSAADTGHRLDAPALGSGGTPAATIRVPVYGTDAGAGWRANAVTDVTDAARPRSTRGQVAIPGGPFDMGDSLGEGYPAAHVNEADAV